MTNEIQSIHDDSAIYNVEMVYGSSLDRVVVIKDKLSKVYSNIAFHKLAEKKYQDLLVKIEEVDLRLADAGTHFD